MDNTEALEVRQQTHVIRAEAIGTERVQVARGLRGVHRPGDHSRAHVVRGLHEVSINQAPVRPDVTWMHAIDHTPHRLHGIGDAPIDENSASNVWRPLGDALDGVVVEGVQREAPAMPACDSDDAFLDLLTFELDVHVRAIPDGLQDVLEGRNVSASVERGQVLPTGVGDGALGHVEVMVHDDHAVLRDVHVQLNGVRPALERAHEPAQRVLRKLGRDAAMADALEGAHKGSRKHRGVYFRNLADGKRLTIRRLPTSTLTGRMTDPGRSGGDPRDAELIARWKAGDQRAAAELVERHASALARFAASCGAREDVDELVQDTFVRAFNSLEGFRGDSAFRTWLFSIERRLLMDRRRAEQRRMQGTEVKETDAATEYDALDELVADEAHARVRDAIERLTPTQREVFVLRVQEGLSYKEIAQAAGTTEGAARVHYHNAMRAVKEFLDDA